MSPQQAAAALPPADLRLAGGVVLTCDPDDAVVHGDVYVTGGRVVAVGGPPQPAARTIDVTGQVVMPGMSNLHDHLRDLHPGISIGEGLRLDELLRRLWRLNEIAGPQEYRLGAALGTARLLKAGVTSVVDHIYPFHRPGLAEAAIEGYAMSGVRWFMARGIMTTGYDPICETQDDAFAAIRELADGVVPRERLLVAPVSFRQTSEDVFRLCRVLADDLGVRLYTHIAETAAEVEALQESHGARPVELLHRLGFAGPDTVMVHCVLLSPEEITQLAGSGTHVVHCPTNHMKLAKGVTPVPALLEAGVNVSLGVDMMTDVLAEMRQEVLLQSLATSNPSAITPATALRMGTAHGARALGMGQESGTVQVGRRADLVVLDLRDVARQPILDPAWTVVNKADSSCVRHVLVDGDVVVQDGRLVRVDEEALVAEAQSLVAHYLQRAGLDEESVLA